ncbi:hypothetical protein SVIOM342S_08975 [Streptomyces violaceorubidus]
MRSVNLGEDPDPAVCAGVGMRPEEVEEMYRLLAIAKYEERYVIPTAAVGDAHRLEASALPDTCSLDTDGGPGMGGDGPRPGLGRASGCRWCRWRTPHPAQAADRGRREGGLIRCPASRCCTRRRRSV